MSIEVRGVCVLLQVFDMPTSVHFYRDMVGFEIVQTTTPREGDQFDWGLLKLNDTYVMLNTAYEQDDRRERREVCGKPRRSLRRPQELHRQACGGEVDNGLVEVGEPIQMGYQIVVRCGHFAGDFGVPPLVGIEEPVAVHVPTERQ